LDPAGSDARLPRRSISGTRRDLTLSECYQPIGVLAAHTWCPVTLGCRSALPQPRGHGLYDRKMAVQQIEVGVDPTRSALLRALRWWWLGAGIALLVGLLYFAASGSAASEVTIERSVWFDVPPALAITGGNFVPETVDRTSNDPTLPDSVTVRLVEQHASVTVSGARNAVEADYAKALAALSQTYQGIVTAKLTPLRDGAQRELDAATQSSDAAASTVASAAPGSTQALVGLTRMLAVEDEAAKARAKVSDLDAQMASTAYMRARSLDEGSTDSRSRGAFDLAVGLAFGAVLGAVAMLVCGSVLRRVGRTTDLAQHKVIGVTLVNATKTSMPTDALVIAGAVPAQKAGTRTVVVSTDGAVPEVVMAAVRQRAADASEVDASPTRIEAEPLDFASQLDGSVVVLVVRRGTSTEHADRLVDIISSRASQFAAAIVVPR
jgi:hypothetical protein